MAVRNGDKSTIHSIVFGCMKIPEGEWAFYWWYAFWSTIECNMCWG